MNIAVQNKLSTEIYKLDSKGKIRTWQYEVVGNGWRTIAGLQDGAKVTSEYTMCQPKSQPTGEAQALAEAEAELAKKLKRDYHTTIESTAKAKYFKPMLAEEYDPTTVEEGDFAQPKLDGIRCIATAKDLRTRKGELITSCPHVSEDLKALFEKYPTAMIDGELYNHAYKDNFNELASIIRKKTPDASQLERAARDIQLHVYDLVLDGNLGVPASTRNNWLADIIRLAGPSIILVPSEPVDNDEQMQAFFERQKALRFEGAMLRKGNAPYRQQRTMELQKLKSWITEEFPVSRLFEGVGNWAGHAKSVEFIMPGDARAEDGERPKAGIKGDKAFTKALLSRDLKIVTIEYQELTPAGVPRFGTAIDWDREDA